MRNYCNYQQDDWSKWLSITEFVSNAITSTFTELFVFMINYEFQSRMSFDFLDFYIDIIDRLSNRERILTQKAIIIVEKTSLNRMTVGLSWTRARAFNSRFGQGWTQCLSPTGWTGQALLTERIDRVRVFVRRVGSNKNFCPLERSIRACCMAETRVEYSTHELNDHFEISGWIRTCKSVRARTLS